MQPTKLEAAICLVKLAMEEPDEFTRNSLLVCARITMRRKMQLDRNNASRARRGLHVFLHHGAPPVSAVPAVPTVPPVPTSSTSDSSASASTTPSPAEA